MPDKPELTQLVLRIATLRDRIASARRLAEEVTDHAAMQGLLDYANELERETAELETRAAILRQEAQTSDVASDIAALKPPPAAEPEAEPDAGPDAEPEPKT